MISVQELENLCNDRLEDAKSLFYANRYDGAVYLCGYVIEMGLKKRICITLGWPGYPAKGKEFEGLASFKTHDLDILLHLSGLEEKVKKNFLLEWSVVAIWDPEIRYSSRTQTEQTADNMINSAERLLKQL